jgi:short-subunit dehydrogenase
MERVALIPTCSARVVAEAGYHGVMRGRRLVIPGRGLTALALLPRLLPRGAVLAAIGKAQARRNRD